MSSPAPTELDLRQRIVDAIQKSPKPVTYKSLLKLGKTKDDELKATLEGLTSSGQVHRWPVYRGSQYYWNVSPDQKAREAILETARVEAMPKTKLSLLAARKLPGYAVKQVEALVSVLVAEKKLQTVIAFTGSSKLILCPGDRDAYFKAARSFLEQKIRAANFDPADFFKSTTSPTPQSADPVLKDDPSLILDAIQSLEPVRGVPVTTLRLRKHLPHLSKDEFDHAALSLRKTQQVFLSQHTDAFNLSEEDKEILIDGHDGTYYVAVALR